MIDVRELGTWLAQCACREAWTARYEQLRAGWFAQTIGWGQALFIRQGMAAWMQAWTTATPALSETQTESAASEHATSHAVVIQSERHRLLAHAFANLILHRHPEVLA